MDREIKLRVWDEGSEIMLYPESNTSGEYIWEFSGSDCKIRILTEEEYHTIEGGEDVVRVDWLPIKCKLMQFTGLKDKNGVDVYEGDICRTGANGKLWIVGFENFSYVFDNKLIEDRGLNKFAGDEGYSFKEYLTMLKNASTSIKVIGNIYENPELIKC